MITNLKALQKAWILNKFYRLDHLIVFPLKFDSFFFIENLSGGSKAASF